MTITSAMDNFMADFCLFQAFKLAACFLGEQGSRTHFCSWLFFSGCSKITSSFVVCLVVLGLKVDLQWVLDWKSCPVFLRFLMKNHRLDLFWLTCMKKKIRILIFFSDFSNLFISFCTIFSYIILGWYHDNLLMKIK